MPAHQLLLKPLTLAFYIQNIMIPTMENLEVTKRFYHELTAIQVGKIGAFDTQTRFSLMMQWGYHHVLV